VDGDVFDDWTDSPCREIIAAARGATTFTVVDLCSRSAQTGAVLWREPGIVTTIALAPPAAIDAPPIVADINGDGHLDVLLRAEGQVYVARSDGKHLSAAVPYRLILVNDTEIAPDIAMPLAAGDFTGDGAPDFVFADRLLTSSVTPASPLPRYDVAFLNLGAPWTEAKIVDLNANGKLDVVAASRGRLGIDFFNGTGGKHLTDFSIPTDRAVDYLAVADLDGDLIDDLAFVEAQPNVVDLPAAEDRRERETDLALGARLERCSEDLAVGEVLVTVGRDPGAAAHGHRQVGVFGDDAEFLLAGEEVGSGL
jgi:hypothetical protein